MTVYNKKRGATPIKAVDVGYTETVDSTAVSVLAKDTDGNVTRAEGETVPSDAETGYAKGCMFVDTNAGTGSVFWINEGDETSADFNVAADAISQDDLTGGTGTATAVSTDAGATANPFIDVYRDSPSPAAQDVIGAVSFNGNNDAGEEVRYATVGGFIIDTTDGAERGTLAFTTQDTGGAADPVICALLSSDATDVAFDFGDPIGTGAADVRFGTFNDGTIYFNPDGTGGVSFSNVGGDLEVKADATAGGLLNYQVFSCVYDFSTDGGSQGAIVPTINATVPDNFVVTAFNYDVITTFTSNTDAATVALGFATDGDIFTTAAISDGSNPLDAGPHPVSGTPIKLTGDRSLQITVAGGEDLTAGKAIFTVFGYLSE